MMNFVLRTKVLHIQNINRRILPVNYGQNYFNFSTSNAAHQIPDTVQILLPTDKSSSSSALKIKEISKAMKAYLERSKKHTDFLKVKNEEFERGKLHLANMMGLDAATLTQDDIDKAITYLLPSGLYEKKARPLMKPPAEMFPKEKAAQFDNSGRPFSPFFYTRFPNYFKCLHTLAGKFIELDDFEDKMIEKGILQPPSDSALNISSGEWLKFDEIQRIFLEKIVEEQYDILIKTLTRLANHPYSFRCKDEIWKYRKDFVDMGSTDVIPPLCTDENGRPYIEMQGSRKHCKAKVIVRGNGTGKITINGSDILYFNRLHDREQVMYPLHFCDMLGKVDVEADVYGPGEGAQAGAIRYGISLCLKSFVPPDFVEKMRLGGLLTRDVRLKGRKKPGQKGNRAKFTWKKR